jgi:GT2 family glycosyltransferase
MTDPRTCILILNWNGADDTLDCLQSLETVRSDHVVPLVIDNGSTDDSVPRINNFFPHIPILELEQNLMYAGGNNAGLNWAVEQGFDYVVFLNNDTTVEPDFLKPLLKVFEADSQIGMAAPLMCYAARPDRVWYGGGEVNLWTGYIAHRHIREAVQQVPSRVVETDYITGCCMMMPTALAQELGGFDTGFKMYGEDVDLSLRCRAKGYRLMFVPESRIYHKVSASVGGEFSLKKIFRKLKGLVQILFRHASPLQWVTVIPAQTVISFKYLWIFISQRGMAAPHGEENS